MDKEQYILNPTRASSLSYWKTNAFKMPSNIIVVNEKEFSDYFLTDYEQELFFKLVYYPDALKQYVLPGNIKFKKIDLEDFVTHINSCYESEGISLRELSSYRQRPVYDERLWICLYNTDQDRIVATGIAEYDDDIKEGSLDWIQVSEEYRGQGFGSIIVYELLNRLNGRAKFVTVSCRVDNQTKPELLYQKCGFKDIAMWHVLRRKV